MKLYKYQNEAVEKLVRKIEPDIDYDTKSTQILKAPTGSGKTIILSSLIDELSNLDYNLCFLWISPGKGGLDRQSYNALKNFLPGHKVSMLSSDFTGGRHDININEVVVMNWEKVNKKGNLLMKDGEKISFPQLIENTRNNGLKIVLLVDESHRNIGAVKSKEVFDLINPDIAIGASATPNKDPTVVVNYSKVRDAGVVKKNAIINKKFGLSEKDEFLWTFQSAEKAYKKIQREYKPYNITPLKLINIENAKGGEDGLEIKLAEEYEAKMGRTVKNGKLAIYTNNVKKPFKDIHSPNIKDFGSKVEALIFKQSITEGWDCPRACILVELRQNMVETFKEQVAGRILRMPERKHYDNYWLDNAFIFTNEREFKIEQDKDGPLAIGADSKLLAGMGFKLGSSHIKKDYSDIQVQNGKFKEFMFEVMEEEYGVG